MFLSFTAAGVVSRCQTFSIVPALVRLHQLTQTFSPPTFLFSGVGWDQARGQAAPDWGEPRATEERRDGADAAGEAGAGHHRVGADQDGDGGPPAHQRPRLQLETEAQVLSKLLSVGKQSLM